MKTRNTYWTIRHGQAESNVQNVTNTHDYGLYHLTDLGRKQSEQAGERLKPEGIRVIYASPFARTKETADILAEHLGAKVLTDERLVELLEAAADGQPAQTPAHDWDVAREGDGTYHELYLRIKDFIDCAECAHDGETILIVTHATPQNMLEAVFATDSEEEAKRAFLAVQTSANPFKENGVAYKAGG